MFQALVLVCSLHAPVCDVNTAEDVQRAEVPMMMCGLAGQSELAAQAGERARGQQVKIMCGKID